GYATTVARVEHRGGGPRVRGVLQLRLSEFDLLAVAIVTTADGEQPTTGVRKAVWHRQQRCRAAGAPSGVAEPARLGHGTSRIAAKGLTRRRSSSSNAVSR